MSWMCSKAFFCVICCACRSQALAVVVAGINGSGESDFRTSPGVIVNGINHDGVGELLVETPNGRFRGSSALLWTGRHLLTAAHVVTDNSGNVDLRSDRNSRVTFELSSGSRSFSFRADDVFVHPLWSGSLLSGKDLAIVDLGEVVDLSIPRYNIYSGTVFDSDIDGRSFTMFGYGRSGTGSTGDRIGSGVKRWGMNAYELNFTGSSLGYDFDNGLASQDYIGEFYDDPDLGLGEFEAISAPGDSGGPTFLPDTSAPGGYGIIGVTSYGRRSSLTDINSSINASFGEYSVDTNVAALSQWVIDELGPPLVIPEPAVGMLLAGAGLCWTRKISCSARPSLGHRFSDENIEKNFGGDHF